MFLIPALYCILSSLYALSERKDSPQFWRQTIIIVCSEYAVMCVLYYLLFHFMAESKGKLPLLPLFTLCLLPYVILFLKQKHSEKIERAVAYLQKLTTALFILFLLEIFVFNAKSLTTAYQSKTYAPDMVTCSGEVRQEGNSLVITGNATLTLYDVPEYAHGLTLPLVQERDENALPYHVKLNMFDDNFSEESVTVQEKLQMGRETDCRLSFQPYGRVHSLKIEFFDVGKPVTLNWVRAASCLPFRFHSLRFWVLSGLTALVIAVITFSWHQIRYRRRNPVHCICVCVVIALCMGLSSAFVRPDGKPYDYTGTPSVNDPYALVFDAFQKGQVWLDIEPDTGLQEIENVYSRGQRDASGAFSHWDYAYFEGKYYCYFGVTPVLLYYYPYYWIHGQLPALSMAVNFFGVWAILFFCLTLLSAIRMFIRHPNLLMLLLLIPSSVVCLGSYHMMNYGAKYHLPMTAGLCMLSLCLLTGIRACMAKRMPLRMILLFLSGASLALCAGARPSMAVGAVTLIPLYIGILLNKRQKLPFRLGQAACFLVPLCAGAAGLMWYNQARFGSPLDFGAAYQLTVSDVHANTLRLTNLWGAVEHYFLIPTRNKTTFPFFESQWGNLNNYQHYVYLEGTIGWLMYPMILMGLLCLYPTLADDRIRYRCRITAAQRKCFLVLCGVTALLVAWMDFSAGGVNQRYLYDIAPLLLLLSAITILRHSRTIGQKQYPYLLFCGSIFLTGIFGSLLLLGIPDGNLMRRCPELYNTIEEMVMFWQ